MFSIIGCELSDSFECSVVYWQGNVVSQSLDFSSARMLLRSNYLNTDTFCADETW